MIGVGVKSTTLLFHRTMKPTLSTFIILIIFYARRIYSESDDHELVALSTTKTFHDLTQQRETLIQFPEVPHCPPSLDEFTREDCEKPRCDNSSNLTANCSGRNEKCCFNGCIFTCTETVVTPPVYDWMGDLRKIPITFEKNTDAPEVECSTSAGRTTHPCPSGSVCQILDRGDPLRAIANRGVCISLDDVEKEGFIPNLDDVISHSDQSSFAKEVVYLPGGCFLTTEQYSDIEDFLKGLHFTSCVCSAGSVMCSVPQTKH